MESNASLGPIDNAMSTILMLLFYSELLHDSPPILQIKVTLFIYRVPRRQYGHVIQTVTCTTGLELKPLLIGPLMLPGSQ